jgi:hypothetical protein
MGTSQASPLAAFLQQTDAIAQLAGVVVPNLSHDVTEVKRPRKPRGHPLMQQGSQFSGYVPSCASLAAMGN